MSEDNGRGREKQGTSPVYRRAPRQVAGIGIVAAALAAIAVVAFLALRGDSGSGGSGSVPGLGSGDPTGPWDVAMTCIDEEISWGRIELSRFSEERLTGDGDLTFPDGDMGGVNIEGEVGEPQEAGLPLNLSFSNGCQLQGTLDGDEIGGTTNFSETNSAGAFAAVRAGDVTEDSRREAVQRYLQAWDVDGDTTGDELREGIGETVVAPFFWDSSGGENAQELAERLGGEEEVRVEIEMADYEAAGSTGVMRYRQDYRFGEDEGAFHGATPARVVRWGGGYRVLHAGAATADPWRNLSGTWVFKPAGELRGGASELRLGPGGTFTATIDDIGYDGGYYLSGRSEDLLDGESEVSGQVPFEGGGTEDIRMTFLDDDGAGEKLSLYDVRLTEEGTLEGTAADESAQGMVAPTTSFTATRVEGTDEATEGGEE